MSEGAPYLQLWNFKNPKYLQSSINKHRPWRYDDKMEMSKRSGRRARSSSPTRARASSVLERDLVIENESSVDVSITNPRSFPYSVKQQCWDKAEKVKGRDPDRWRRDPLGNIVFRKLVGCPGCLCHDYDHILPYSKGGLSTLDNCQVLQVILLISSPFGYSIRFNLRMYWHLHSISWIGFFPLCWFLNPLCFLFCFFGGSHGMAFHPNYFCFHFQLWTWYVRRLWIYFKNIMSLIWWLIHDSWTMRNEYYH